MIVVAVRLNNGLDTRKEIQRMRVSHRIQANMTGPDAVSAQRFLREEKRDRQHCRRERLNAERLNSARVLLPLHQSEALVDFLDRLHRVQDDLHECDICLEKYYSMKNLEDARVTVRQVLSRGFVVFHIALHLLTLYRKRYIGTVQKTTWILAKTLLIYIRSCLTSLKWKKCCVASPPHVFLCGSAKEGSIKHVGMSLHFRRTSHNSAWHCLACLSSWTC